MCSQIIKTEKTNTVFIISCFLKVRYLVRGGQGSRGISTLSVKFYFKEKSPKTNMDYDGYMSNFRFVCISKVFY